MTDINNLAPSLTHILHLSRSVRMKLILLVSLASILLGVTWPLQPPEPRDHGGFGDLDQHQDLEKEKQGKAKRVVGASSKGNPE